VWADLDRITRAGRTPHGYTLVVWAAGMSCIRVHGLPGLAAMLSFTLGATVVFGAARLLTRCRRPRPTREVDAYPAVASIHLIALPAAVLTSVFVGNLGSPWCWPATSAAATVTFVVLHAAQDALVRRWLVARRRRVRATPASANVAMPPRRAIGTED
jgi:hypothetical protein